MTHASAILDPLALPQPDSPLLAEFLRAFGIPRDLPPEQLLSAVGAAFARLPYENLTKIIRAAASGSVVESRRVPAVVLADHFQVGTGGTCFSLTATLLHLIRALGWRAEPILADRRYGADTHCALVVWIDGRPHLLDPGYLITSPLLLPETGEIARDTEFNQVLLRATAGGSRVELRTRQNGHESMRLTFKSAPVDRCEFLKAWDASFDWDMMHYPLLTRVSGHRQTFLNRNRLQVRSSQDVTRLEVDPNQLIERIQQEFGIAPEVVANALAILNRQGVRDAGGS
jgi:arylamine N-acetyltransferase